MEEPLPNPSSQNSESSSTGKWRDLGLLLLLMLLAGGVRGWLISHTAVTARDGVGFIRFAWELEHDPDLHKVLRNNLHPPGYPAAILGMSLALRPLFGTDPEAFQRYAQLTSALAGVVLVIPLFYLGKRLFNRGVGFWAAALFTCLPIGGRILADGLSEGVFLFLAATALLLAAWALERGSWILFGLCGLCCGLAYLTRPEGLLLAATVGVVLLGIQMVPQFRLGWRRTVVCGTALVAAAAAVGAPYAVVIGNITNKPTTQVILQADGPDFLEPGDFPFGKDADAPEVAQAEGAVGGPLWAFWAPDFLNGPRTGRLLLGLWGVVKELYEGLNYVAWLPALLGLWWFRDRLRTAPAAWLLLSLCAIHFLVLVRLSVVMGYVSERHILLLAMCLSFWAVAAVQELPARLAGLGWWKSATPARIAGLQFALLFVLVAYSLPVTLKPLHANRTGHHAAGSWLAEHAAPDDVILDPFCWAEFYAGRVVGPDAVPNYYATAVVREGKQSMLQHGQPPAYVVKSGAVSNEHARLWLISEAKRWADKGRLVFRWQPQRKRDKAEPIEVYFVPPQARGR